MTTTALEQQHLPTAEEIALARESGRECGSDHDFIISCVNGSQILTSKAIYLGAVICYMILTEKVSEDLNGV